MKNFIRYNIVKPYLSIFIAGFVAGQSVFATLPAPAANPPVGETGLRTAQNLAAIERYEKATKRGGYGLSDVKSAEEVRKITTALLNQTSSAVTKVAGGTELESTVISGANVAKKIITEKIETYKTLHEVMKVNKRALDVLINSPLKNPTLKKWYIAILLANGIPAFMAFNDKKGTPWIKWHREKFRAWAMAFPLVLSAIVRWQDPTSTIDLMKINEEIKTELEALGHMKGATAEFRDQISDIISVTSNQLGESAKNYGMVESMLKGVYNAEESKAMTYAIAGGSVLYALLLMWDKRAADWVQSARAAAIAVKEALPEIQAATKAAIASTQEAVIAGQQAVQAGAKVIQAEVAEARAAGAWESTIKFAGSKGSTTTTTTGSGAFDVMGYGLASTSDRAAGIAAKVSGDYGKLVTTIELTIERMKAHLDAAKQAGQ